MYPNGNRERNVNYVIRESHYLVGDRYHDDSHKFDCSIKNAEFYAKNASKMTKEERTTASMWAARCLFDRMLKREEFARKLNARSGAEDVLKFLKHEHVLRLFVSCASILRDWDDRWASTLFLVGTMLVNVPDSSVRAAAAAARTAESRARVIQQIRFLTGERLYVHLMTRLRNAIANRPPLSAAFDRLAGPVRPVVANAHRKEQRNGKSVMMNFEARLSKRRK